MKLIKIGSNVTEMETKDGLVILFSYETPVAARFPNGRCVRTSKKWSQTTTKHINKWLPSNSLCLPVEELEQYELDLILKGE